MKPCLLRAYLLNFMKLYELKEGQRFEFETRLPGHIFEITEKSLHNITYIDVATGEKRETSSVRKTFKMDVNLVIKEKHLTLTEDESKLLQEILHEAYKLSAENGDVEERRNAINKIYNKLIR